MAQVTIEILADRAEIEISSIDGSRLHAAVIERKSKRHFEVPNWADMPTLPDHVAEALDNISTAITDVMDGLEYINEYQQEIMS